MANPTTSVQLPAHTRVTFMYAVPGYEPQETQGVIREGSTSKLAKVEVLGLAKSRTIGLPWNAVTKVEYRCFKVTETTESVLIAEVEPKNSHWMNWMGFGEMSREGAWSYAGARGKQTFFKSREGQVQDLGKVFSPKSFERAAYAGYASYGHSMSDGYYAPEKFDSWVKSFRKHPAEHLASQNDASESVKAALPLYLEALAAAGL